MRKGLLLLILMMALSHLGINAQNVKVISFNIRNSVSSRNDGTNSWPNRSAAVIRMLKEENPTVFGLQEALLDQLSNIDKPFIKKYRRVGVGRDNGITRGEHMAIYYNYHLLDLVSYTTRWLSETPTRLSIGWDASCPRTVTIALFRVKATGKSFYYFNTQLDGKGTVSRKESIKLLARLIQTETRSSIPVILGGDMDSNIDDLTFNPLFRIGMDEAREIAPKTDHKITYTGYGKKRPAIKDHFLTRGLKIQQFRTITKRFGIPYLSDHYPIEIIFNL